MEQRSVTKENKFIRKVLTLRATFYKTLAPILIFLETHSEYKIENKTIKFRVVYPLNTINKTKIAGLK